MVKGGLGYFCCGLIERVVIGWKERDVDWWGGEGFV